MPGPRKKSAQIKSISGTVRPCREPEAPGVELPILDELPAPPDWLPNTHATKEWERLGRILVANKILTGASLMAFAHLCALHGKIVQLWTAGETPTGHMLSQLRGLFDSFGLPPAAAGKVKSAGGEEPKPNGFAKRGKRGA